MKLLAIRELSAKGIPYHPQHIRKLIKAGRFPRPIRLGGGNRIAFVETEIDDYIKSRIAERDGQGVV